MYVFREILVLTGFGIFAGLFMGYGLHRYVMYNVNVEAVTFDTKILPQSYLYGVALTFLFALLVDFVLYFKLERIKMAESLKSVE
jgi:putative ABC transport system permease protein